jgi:PIN domain nuclease of toxin-antitoxin system
MIILDTCAIIWDALASNKLTQKAKQSIESADYNNELIICDISIWEISMLVQRKRLEIDTTAANFINLFIQSRNIQVQSITPEIAELSVNLSKQINNDPADRLIAATSIIRNT